MDHRPSPTLRQKEGGGGGRGEKSIVRSIKNAKKFADLGTYVQKDQPIIKFGEKKVNGFYKT